MGEETQRWLEPAKLTRRERRARRGRPARRKVRRKAAPLQVGPGPKGD